MIEPDLVRFGVPVHAQRRAAERLATPMDRAAWLKLLLDITGRNALLLRDQPGGQERRELWLCRVGAELVQVVWAPDIACIVTVMAQAGKRRLTHTIRHVDSYSHGHTRAVPRRAKAIRWDVLHDR